MPHGRRYRTTGPTRSEVHDVLLLSGIGGSLNVTGAGRVPYFLEVPLADGESVLAEITGQVDDVGPVGLGRDIVGRLPDALGAGLERVQAFAAEVLSGMRAYPEPPDTVAVEFGLKLTAKTGVVIAESSGEAHLKVAAQWNRAATPPAEDPLAE